MKADRTLVTDGLAVPGEGTGPACYRLDSHAVGRVPSPGASGSLIASLLRFGR